MSASPYDPCAQERDRLLDKVAALEAELATERSGGVREAAVTLTRAALVGQLRDAGFVEPDRDPVQYPRHAYLARLHERDEARALLAKLRAMLEAALPLGPHIHSLTECVGFLVKERDEARAERDAAFKAGWDAAKKQDADVIESANRSAHAAYTTAAEAYRLVTHAAQWLEPSSKLAELTTPKTEDGGNG